MCDIEDDAAEGIDIGNDDDVADQEEENCFSRIVKVARKPFVRI